MASVESLLRLEQIDIAKMNRKQLAGVVSQLSSAANKRLARLEQAGVAELSPAYGNVLERGTSRFSIAGKNTNQLRHEFANIRKFLQSKTSTVTGVKAWKRKVEKKLGTTFTFAEFANFNEAMRELRKVVGRDVIAADSTNIANWMRQEIANPANETPDGNVAVDAVIARINANYEDFMEKRAELWGGLDIDEFYDIDADESYFDE